MTTGQDVTEDGSSSRGETRGPGAQGHRRREKDTYRAVPLPSVPSTTKTNARKHSNWWSPGSWGWEPRDEGGRRVRTSGYKRQKVRGAVSSTVTNDHAVLHI